MRVTRLMRLFVPAIMLAAAAARGQVPVNDNCASAKVITLGTTLGTNLNATIDGSAICDSVNPGPDVWYRLDILEDNFYMFDTCGSSIDTTLSLYPACPVGMNQESICNDDSYGFKCDGTTSVTGLEFQIGQSIYIRVAGYNSSSVGNFQLNIGVPPAVTNNDCANAILMQGARAYTSYTGDATRDGSSSICPNTNLAADVWYKYIPAFDGVAHFYTCQSNYDPYLTVYPGCPGDTTNDIACSIYQVEAACADGGDVQVYLPVQQGEEYLIRVSGFFGSRGITTLRSELSTAPASQNVCGDASYITYGDYTGSTAGKTSDGTAPCASAASPDVWYAFLPHEDRLVNFNLCGSTMDTSLSLHTGCPGTASNDIACATGSSGIGCQANQASATIAVSTGVPVYVRVTGAAAGVSGAYQLHISPDDDTILPADACAPTFLIGFGTVAGLFTGITRDGSSSCEASNQVVDLWYKFTSPISGIVDFNTCGSSIPIALSLHSGCPGTTANQLACNSNSTGPLCLGQAAAEIKRTMSPGETVWIRLARQTVNGSYQLNVEHIVPPVNDTCVSDVLGILSPGVFTGNSAGASPEGTASCFGATAADVWFVLLSEEAGLYTISSCGTEFDTGLSVHQYGTCPGTIATQIACNDDSACGTASQVSFMADGTSPYLIRLAGLSGSGGEYILTVTSPYDGRAVGDFDNTHCTDLLDFLFLLDNWTLISPIGPPEISITDFLNLLDNWQLGSSCV